MTLSFRKFRVIISCNPDYKLDT